MATAARLAVAGRATAGVEAPAVVACGATRQSLRVLADRLDLDVQLDLVADHEAATFERHVELDAEVAPADLTRSAEAGAGAHRGVGLEAVDLELERYLLGDPVERQLAVDDEPVAGGAHARRAVRHLGVGVDLEEVGGPG